MHLHDVGREESRHDEEAEDDEVEQHKQQLKQQLLHEAPAIGTRNTVHAGST